MEINCPYCCKILRVPDGAVGRRCRCPSCMDKFVIADPRTASLNTVAGFVVEQDRAGPKAQS